MKNSAKYLHISEFIPNIAIETHLLLTEHRMGGGV